METTEILTNEIVAEAAEDVMETGLGTGGKVFLGLVATAGAVFAGYKIYKKIKNKKENIADIEAAEGEVVEEE